MLFLEAEYLVLRNLATELGDHLVLGAEQAVVLLGVQWHIQGSLLHLLTAQVVQVLVVA